MFTDRCSIRKSLKKFLRLHDICTVLLQQPSVGITLLSTFD